MRAGESAFCLHYSHCHDAVAHDENQHAGAGMIAAALTAALGGLIEALNGTVPLGSVSWQETAAICVKFCKVARKSAWTHVERP